MQPLNLCVLASCLVVVALLLLKLNHLLSLMITLEYLFLLILLIFLLQSNEDQLELVFVRIFLATAAAESAVALSRYVLITRFYRKDYIGNFFTTKL